MEPYVIPCLPCPKLTDSTNSHTLSCSLCFLYILTSEETDENKFFLFFYFNGLKFNLNELTLLIAIEIVHLDEFCYSH